MDREPNKLDCFVRVITPENIEFEYALAGPFQRLPAFLFDFVLRIVVFVGIMVAAGMLTSWMPINNVVLTVLSLLMFFGLSWFYGIFFETRFNGRTVGKMLFHLRVISVDGRPINGVQAALRNLLRLADMGVFLSLQIIDANAPPRYLIPTMVIGLTAMTLSPRLQRIGDLAAGTMVVAEERRRSPWNLLPEDPRAFGLAELIPANFQASSSLAQTIGLYMENRRRLSSMRRNEVARHVSDPLIGEFELLPDTSPDLLLCALYIRIYLSPDQQAKGLAQLRELRTGFPARNRHLKPPASSPAAGQLPTAGSAAASPFVESLSESSPKVPPAALPAKDERP